MRHRLSVLVVLALAVAWVGCQSQTDTPVSSADTSEGVAVVATDDSAPGIEGEEPAAGFVKVTLKVPNMT